MFWFIPVKVLMTSADNSGYSYTGKKVVGELIVLPPVPKDNKRYTITVETFAEKFAPKKKAATTFRADSYFKFVTVVLPKASNTPGTTTSKKTSNMFIFVVPFLILAVVAFLSRDKLPLLFAYINEKMSKHPISSQTNLQTANVKDAGDSGDDSATLDPFNLGGIARKRIKKRLA